MLTGTNLTGHSYRWQQAVIAKAAKRYAISPALMWGIFGAESDFARAPDTNQRNYAGAKGPWQMTPGTAQEHGILGRENDFVASAYAAAAELAKFKKYGWEGMAAGYNGGPGAVTGHRYAETRAYIPKVLQLAKSWPGAGGVQLAGTGGMPASSRGSSAPTTLKGSGSPSTVAALLSALGTQQRQQVPLQEIPQPSFSARSAVPFPAGYQPQGTSTVPTQSKSSLDALLKAIGGLRAPVTLPGTPAAPGGAPHPGTIYRNYKGYVNPVPLGLSYDPGGRIDQGKDFTAQRGHSLLSIGNAVITNIQTGVQGFGTVLYYRLLDGPYKGRTVFQGHSGKVLVQVGQRVRAGQPVQLAYGNEGGPGHVELGWANPGSTGTLARDQGNIDPLSHYSPAGQSFADLFGRLPRVRLHR